MLDDQELDNEDNNTSYRESQSQMNDQDDDVEGNDQDALAEAGLEDSDAENEAVKSLYYPLILSLRKSWHLQCELK